MLTIRARAAFWPALNFARRSALRSMGGAAVIARVVVQVRRARLGCRRRVLPADLPTSRGRPFDRFHHERRPDAGARAAYEKVARYMVHPEMPSRRAAAFAAIH